jgi:serine/threonine-protein kinase RsbW
VEIRIPADPRWVRMVRLAAAGVASVLNFSVDEIEDIKSAVAEACNNAILHARPFQQSEQLPTVIVTMIPARDYLEIRVEDEGRVADGIAMPAGKAKNAATYAATYSDALPVGGLGLLFIEAMMDEVRLQSGADTNTTLTMVKKRRPLG